MIIDSHQKVCYTLSDNEEQGKMRTNDHTTQVGMRFPNDLFEKIKIMAEKDGRSMTNMVVHLLKLQLKVQDGGLDNGR